MQRKVISLARNTVLWEAGDAARTVAVVTKGKLGARTDVGLVGIILPNMVLGEAALFGTEQPPERRKVTVFAAEDDTVVVEYPAETIRDRMLAGDDELAQQITYNLVGQISRNLLMVVTSRRGHPYVDAPLTSLARAVLRDACSRPAIRSWENLQLTFRFLCDLRDLSDRLLATLGPDISQRAEMIVNASQMLGQVFEGGETDVRPLLELFLEAERERNDWWTQAREA